MRFILLDTEGSQRTMPINGSMREIDWKIQLHNRQFSPGKEAKFNFTYANNNKYHHKISRIFAIPSWDIEIEYSMDVNIEVDPMSEVNLPNFDVRLPDGLGGEQSIMFGTEVAGHNKYTDEMTAYEVTRTDGPLFLPLNYSTYRAFVSRSNHPSDDQISDTLQNEIRNWGFETDTLFTNVDDPVGRIVSDAQEANCLFGIAVPRYETLGGERPQFHYLDGEAGMALVREIPVVIFEHEEVDLKGLPQECLRVEFKDPNSNEFKQAFSEVMLWVRQTIRENKQGEFINTVIKMGSMIGVGALIHAGLGTESEKEPELE